MSSKRPKVALVGLPSHHEMVPEHVRDLVKEHLEKLGPAMEEAGYDYKLILASPEDGLEKMTSAFSSYSPDGIVIGFGIRGIPGNTEFFEQVIAATRAGAPDAKLLFNTSPESTVDAAKRGFPLHS